MMAIQSRAERMLTANGISPLSEERWYPIEGVLKTFEDIQRQIGPNTVRTIGRKCMSLAEMPVFHSLEEALRGLGTAYMMNHRGDTNIGGYHYSQVGTRRGRMMCDNPYPCEFDEGLIDALIERFRPPDAFVIRFEHDPSTCRSRGDKHCTYTIAW
jgi:hypothetical protein